MDIDNNAKRDWLRSIISDFYLFVVIMTICIGFITFCSSCSSSRPVVLERTLHDTVHVKNLRLDSIFQHDSIYFESITKGDTVYLTKKVTHWRNLISIKRDTAYVVREKTVDIPIPQEKTVPLWLRILKYVSFSQFFFPFVLFVAVMIWLYHRKI